MTKFPALLSNKFARLGALAVLVLLSAFVWFQFTYPRFSHMDLSISRQKAIDLAVDFIKKKNQISVDQFHQVVVFNVDLQTDRYLQKAIGFKKTNAFIDQYNYDLFYWVLRFFNEGKKEEYSVVVSSHTGEIISYAHVLEESASRNEITEEEAQRLAQQFFEKNFGFNFRDWVFHSKSNIKLDHRIEYQFTWERKSLFIPWNANPKMGGGKLLAMANVSGDEILGFNKQSFLVPEEFIRHIERKKESGRNLGLIANIGSLIFMIGAIWVLLSRRNHLSMNATKKFYLNVIAFLFGLSVISAFNNSQGYLYSYPTTQPLIPFIIRQALNELLDRFFFYVAFIIPCLAGELLRFEMHPKKPKMSFYHYVTTTFFSRDVAQTLLFGYCFAVIMVGLQTAIFEFGFRYCDVWVEQERLSRFSTAYFPFLGILIMAANASITEETLYRLFGYHFSLKMLRNSFLAVVIPSVIWGLGHTGYMVFPFWFRGVEVTLLGILTIFIYRRFGLLCVIVQHFLFDAFWASSPYIFGKSVNFDFWMSLLVLAIPFFIAISAYLINRPIVKKNIQWLLNKQQKYNLEILKSYIEKQRQERSFDANALRPLLIQNGWDVAVVDVAFKDLRISLSVDNSYSDP